MIKDTIKKPAIVIENVTLNPMTLLYINDTTDITKQSKTMEADYAELLHFIQQNGLKAGRLMAFYLNYQNPLSLEAAIEVDRLPGHLSSNIHSKKIEGGNAVVVHYKGPYEEMGIAYNAITRMMTDNKKQAKGLPFEVYLNDLKTVKDKHELKTAIYQLLQ